MKCRCCGAEIVKIDTIHGKIVCDAGPVTYWASGRKDTEVLTPNGETVYCRLSGNVHTASGIGYTRHTCGNPA